MKVANILCVALFSVSPIVFGHEHPAQTPSQDTQTPNQAMVILIWLQ